MRPTVLHDNEPSHAVELQLLGSPVASYAGAPLRNGDGKPLSSKVVALLCYLAVEGRPVPRREAAALLWPGLNNANLRVALSQLRSCAGAHLWLQGGESLGLAATTDLARFEGAVDDGMFEQALAIWGETTDPQRHLLAGAERQLPEEFLDLWLAPRREDAYRRYLRALYQGALEAELLGEHQRALEWGRRLTSSDPLHESGHQLVMRLLHRLGEHQAALGQYEELRHTLRTEGLPAPLPETALLARQAQGAQEAQQREQAKTSESLHARLASLPTPFVGREREVKEVTALLTGASGRLLTLQGAGGAGKSRLALEVARRAASRFPDGVVFVPLEAIDDPALLEGAVAAALGLNPSAGEGGRERLLSQARGRRLLILDNFEQLLEGAELVDELAAHTAGAVLVTSRASLELRREQLYEVAGLEAPQDPTSPAFEENAAVRLFVQSARRADPDYRLDGADAEAFVQLSRFVAGMPLFLEHLATWTRLMPVRAMLAELESSLELFATPHVDLPERHRRLDLVLERSWELLPARSKKTLAELAVFRGGFTREAAREVAGADLPTLKGLLTHAFIRPAQGGRFGLFESHRQFALGKLLTGPGAAGAFARRAKYYAAFAAEASAGMRTGEQALWLQRLDAELDNVRALLAWAEAEGAAAVGLQVSTKLSAYWEQRGLWREGLAYLTTFLARAGEEQPNYPDALRSASHLHQLTGNMGEAGALLDRAIEAYRKQGDQAGLASGLIRAGVFHAQRGELRRTVDFFEQSLAIHEELGDDYATSITLLNLGVAYSDLYDYPASRAYLERALVMKRRVEDTYGLVLATSSLAFLAVYEGRLEDADPLIEEALAGCAELGLLAERSYVLITAGWLARERGAFAAARTTFEEALSIAREIDDRVGESHALAHLGFLSHLQGDRGAALERYARALPIQYELESAVTVLGSLFALALVAEGANDPARAARLYGAVAALEARSDARLTARDREALEAVHASVAARLGAEPTARLVAEGAHLDEAGVMSVALEY